MDADIPHASPAAGRDEPLLPGITGVVLTRNGERLIEKCLASLAFCEALLVVDSGSADATEAVAAQHGARFIFRQWDGFAGQFRFAQTQVRTQWFFILDQDEICLPLLGEMIRQKTAEADGLAAAGRDAPSAFSISRRSWYFDRFMKHGGWYPDHILRVFRTGTVEFYQDAHIHYRALGGSGELRGGPDAEVIHYPYTGFFHQLEKLNTYAEQGAESLRAKGRRGGIVCGIGHGFARFMRIYVIKLGFLDGRAGFLAAAHGAFYAFLKYVRVLEADWGEPFDKH